MLRRKQRIGFFDIETTGLSYANPNNIIVAYGILIGDSEEPKIEVIDDKNEEAELLSTMMEDLKKIDTIVGYNINRFDIPFTLVRSWINSVDASILFKRKVIDLLPIARKKLALPSYRLDYVAYSLAFGDFTYPIKSLRIPQYWNIERLNGNDFDLIFSRLKYDLQATRFVYKKLVEGEE